MSQYRSPMAGSVFKVAVAALLLFQSWTSAYVKRQKENQWVDIWGTMPQLVEPANLPPAPYASILSSRGILPLVFDCNKS